MLGTAIFVVATLIIAVLIIVEIKRMRHKIFAIFLIGLILFSYFSFSTVFKGKEIDIKSFSGIAEAGQIYFSWLGSIFSNVKTITTNAISMDWKGNETVKEISQ